MCRDADFHPGCDLRYFSGALRRVGENCEPLSVVQWRLIAADQVHSVADGNRIQRQGLRNGHLTRCRKIAWLILPACDGGPVNCLRSVSERARHAAD